MQVDTKKNHRPVRSVPEDDASLTDHGPQRDWQADSSVVLDLRFPSV